MSIMKFYYLFIFWLTNLGRCT